jgi:TFIIF-interacting CTD phosphatase-like protein
MKGQLPPLLKEMKTLILDLDETLIHSTFTKDTNADFTLPVLLQSQIDPNGR